MDVIQTLLRFSKLLVKFGETRQLNLVAESKENFDIKTIIILI